MFLHIWHHVELHGKAILIYESVNNTFFCTTETSFLSKKPVSLLSYMISQWCMFISSESFMISATAPLVIHENSVQTRSISPCLVSPGVFLSLSLSCLMACVCQCPLCMFSFTYLLFIWAFFVFQVCIIGFTILICVVRKTVSVSLKLHKQ